ncbi:tyrosine--tRNA ligase [Betaproteobacteria bacterium]|nr:tyrosine--tRNA ligase [Betaproteobacteria bacterium]
MPKDSTEKHNLDSTIIDNEKAKEIFEIIQRGSEEILVESDLKKKITLSMQEGKPLNVKLGLDPTSPDLHLGHTVVLMKLRELQKLGHKVTLLIGDFTAKIGDPSGRNATRPVLTDDEIEENSRTYFEQVGLIIDMDAAIIRKNSEWANTLSSSEMIRLAGVTTVARMLERDDFTKRYQSGKSISLHEFLYPIMQGYDSFVLNSDLELGGTDQKFNLLMGRDVQRFFGQDVQCILTMPILEGLDGVDKMSKSKNNYIGLKDEADQMFGKIMSVSDELMWRYIDLLTFKSDSEKKKLKQSISQGQNPKNIKIELASDIVERFYNRETALKVANDFEERFKNNKIPESIDEKVFEGESFDIVFLLKNTGLVRSTSDAFRSIQQGAVRVDGQKVLERELVLKKGCYVLQVGKRSFIRVRVG